MKSSYNSSCVIGFLFQSPFLWMLIVTISYSATIKDISKSLTSSNAIQRLKLQKQLNRLKTEPQV